MNYYIILGILLWYFIGAASFIYWWTKSYDFSLFGEEAACCLVTAFGGPFAFIVGWTIHGKPIKGKILFKKRL